MALRHRKRSKPDLDERISLSEDTDPDEVLRRLLATPGSVEDESAKEHPDSR